VTHCDPQKESALAGSIAAGSFELIPKPSLVPAEAFTDPRWRIVYSAACRLRAVISATVVCAESVSDYVAFNNLDRELQTAVDSTRTISWRKWPEFADTSLAFGPTTRPLEYCLQEIGLLYSKRRAAQIGQQLQQGGAQAQRVRDKERGLRSTCSVMHKLRRYALGPQGAGLGETVGSIDASGLFYSTCVRHPCVPRGVVFGTKGCHPGGRNGAAPASRSQRWPFSTPRPNRFRARSHHGAQSAPDRAADVTELHGRWHRLRAGPQAAQSA
jgi:hypothetical protein